MTPAPSPTLFGAPRTPPVRPVPKTEVRSIVLRGRGPHAALVRYLIGRLPARYEAIPLTRHRAAATWFDIVLLGTGLGATIGAITGAAVAAWLWIIGALWGAPIGAVLGAAIGLPASIVLTLVLIGGDPYDPVAVHRHAAGTLAVLCELLVLAELGGAIYAGTHAYDHGGFWSFVLLWAIAVYGWLDLRLLRWATRVLADAFSTHWGWKAVRP